MPFLAKSPISYFVAAGTITFPPTHYYYPFRSLTVLVRRQRSDEAQSGVLKAWVVMDSAAGEVKGSNLLTRRCLTKVESAQKTITFRLSDITRKIEWRIDDCQYELKKRPHKKSFAQKVKEKNK